MRSFRQLSFAFAAAATAALLTCAGSASAQLRSIPDDAKRGQIRHVREMIVEINGEQARLSPGAQIRGRENRIILPAALPAEPQLVKFLVDSAGMVHRVWILTEEEASRQDKTP